MKPTQSSSPCPSVGDLIYVRSRWSIDHGEDDVQGGRATVTEVKLAMSAGRMVPFVSVAEHPGCSYNWEFLSKEQSKLAEQFGAEKARPDPDFG